MESVDCIRARTGSAGYQLTEEAFTDYYWSSQQHGTRKVDPDRSQNGMIREKGDVESLEPFGGTDENTDSN